MLWFFETLTREQGSGRPLRRNCCPAYELMGPELIRDLVSLMQQAEFQSRMQAALQWGFQTRDAELELPRLLGEVEGVP
ncbi:hypothetical protein MES5069_1740004 [Mesorhizobium escarrei]|uniref:Uncharacterized protein n=1 Tax=Mesorhizobium escarrei TaxID=666018 RepID=A0ABM9DLT5_9HYPH|nr:hypothetical protein MES5069_1740004 [Mesorhizobium escarrei]